MEATQPDGRELLKVRQPGPCASCPYRRDVPSGVWAHDEYEKLRAYDGGTLDQLMHEATGVFCCHQDDGSICAGWAGCHDMDENLALRLNHDKVDPAIYDYQCPVPLWDSGAEAADHGQAEIGQPDAKAVQAIAKITRVREIRGNPVRE